MEGYGAKLPPGWVAPSYDGMKPGEWAQYCPKCGWRGEPMAAYAGCECPEGRGERRIWQRER